MNISKLFGREDMTLPLILVHLFVCVDSKVFASLYSYVNPLNIGKKIRLSPMPSLQNQLLADV